MRRELAFALEARSQFGCFAGRTRSSEPSSGQFTDSNTKNKSRSAKSSDGVHVNRRNKRIKFEIPDGDLVNVDKSAVKGEDKIVNGEEATAGAEESTAAAEVVIGEEEGKGSEVKDYVKHKKRKGHVTCNTPKRFTRSALKEKEDLGTPNRKKMELKMSKKIGFDKMPTNVRGLLETGLLEGFPVCYKLESQGANLQGVIKGVGILCSCSDCVSSKVIPPSQFEMHALKAYRHAIRFIFLENGKSLLELVEICKAAASETLDVALQTVLSSLPAKGPSICTKCNSSLRSSSSENLLICDSCLSKEDVDAEPTVATCSEVRASTPEPKFPESNSLPCSTDIKTKSKRGRKPKSSKSALKLNKSAGNHKLSRDKTKSEIHKRNQQLHWSVFQKGGLPDGTELTYVAQGKKLLDGYKWNNRIVCSCCKTEISASQFEAHAGRASRKKPYENIFISNGVSLHEYAVSMKMNEKGFRVN